MYIDNVLATAVVAETSEGYDVVIGENPNGDGHIALYILGSTIIGATSVETVEDTIEREKEDEQSDEELTDEEEIDDAPGTEQDWRLSEREKLWIRTVGDFALDVYKASNIYDQYSDDDDDDINPSHQEVTFFDMQKGQSVLVESGSENVLIDAGSKSTGSYNNYASDLREEVNENRENSEYGEPITIDRLVITHGHEDHIAFVDDLIEDDRFDIEAVYWNQVSEADPEGKEPDDEALAAIEAAEASSDLTYHKNTELESGTGDNIEAPGTDFEIVNPETLDEEDGDADSESLAMTITIDGRSFHIATDHHVNSDVQANSNVDVTTTMHHGSSNSEAGPPDNTVEWFEGMNPTYVVLQVSGVNRVSHPTDETLNNINRVASVEHLYISDEYGGVSFTVKDGDIEVEAQQDAPTDPSNWSPDSSEQNRITPGDSRRMTP
ncbi:ComEC/Rec2 family competence protein [Haloarcula vallismortis]|uniref:ComEC/Rec2 family competence protein n=1 Tax=Haloarcula vallismortis TaxID=28442 RepID=UPI001113484A|nr:MBL fold metallo-hydrolase [Haloarcula vallismortis]